MGQVFGRFGVGRRRRENPGVGFLYGFFLSLF